MNRSVLSAVAVLLGLSSVHASTVANLTVRSAKMNRDIPVSVIVPDGVAVTNLCGKRLAGTSIGFISLFSYIGASLSGKVCGNLVQSTGSWFLPVVVIGATVAFGAVVFLFLWGTKANNYETGD